MLLAVESQPLPSLPSPRAGWKSETIVAIVLFLVGISLFFRLDQIPGGFDDARFNMYVLEHGYRWLTRLDKSFWSAPFFYPAQNVITYSDNHLGSFLFYSVFRLLGAGRETVFQLWGITLFTLNYFVTWIVLRRQGFHPVGAMPRLTCLRFLSSWEFELGSYSWHHDLWFQSPFGWRHVFLRQAKENICTGSSRNVLIRFTLNLHRLFSHPFDQLVLSVSISVWKVERNQCLPQERGPECDRPPGRGVCSLLCRLCFGAATLSDTLLPDTTEDWTTALGGNRSDDTALAVISPRAGIISLG